MRDGRRRQPSSAAPSRPRVLNTLAACDVEHGLIVVDDLHRISDPAVFEFLDRLLERTAAAMGVVVATRTEPPLRWRGCARTASWPSSASATCASSARRGARPVGRAARRCAAARSRAPARAHPGLGGRPAPGGEQRAPGARRPAPQRRARDGRDRPPRLRLPARRGARPAAGRAARLPAALLGAARADRGALRRAGRRPAGGAVARGDRAARPVRLGARGRRADAAPARPVPRVPAGPPAPRDARRAAGAATGAPPTTRARSGAAHRLWLRAGDWPRPRWSSRRPAEDRVTAGVADAGAALSRPVSGRACAPALARLSCCSPRSRWDWDRAIEASTQAAAGRSPTSANRASALAARWRIAASRWPAPTATPRRARRVDELLPEPALDGDGSRARWLACELGRDGRARPARAAPLWRGSSTRCEREREPARWTNARRSAC